MMKKCIVVLLTIVLVIGIIPAGMSRSDAAITFKDVPSDEWYYGHVQFIVNYKYELMVGYAGNFGPSDELTVEQFIKITVAAAGRGVVVPQGQNWGDVYVPIGLELGFVLQGEFSDYKRAITRAEMARIIIRSLPTITGESSVTYNVNDIKARMVDYDSIPANLKDYVCKAYQLGILSGGTDKTFKPNDSLKRASAASVIHLMLDPTARAVASTSEMWTDAEFEAFMKSSDADKYVNHYLVSKIENRKIYWKSSKSSTPTLIPEANNPGVNDMAYNIVKIMAYHTKKVNGYLSLIYDDEYDEGVFLVRFFVNEGYQYQQMDGDIALTIYPNPNKCYTAKKYFSGQQQGDSHYEWVLGVLHNDDDIKGYKFDMDRSKFVWTAPRYEEIFKEMCQEVYGANQGITFFNFALKENDNVYDYENYTAQYIGFKAGVGCEIVYYYPDSVMLNRVWTDKPEERK